MDHGPSRRSLRLYSTLYLQSWYQRIYGIYYDGLRNTLVLDDRILEESLAWKTLSYLRSLCGWLTSMVIERRCMNRCSVNKAWETDSVPSTIDLLRTQIVCQIWIKYLSFSLLFINRTYPTLFKTKSPSLVCRKNGCGVSPGAQWRQRYKRLLESWPSVACVQDDWSL